MITELENVVETPWTFSAFRLPTVWFSVVKFPTVSSRTLKLPTDPANVNVPTVRLVMFPILVFKLLVFKLLVFKLLVFKLLVFKLPALKLPALKLPVSKFPTVALVITELEKVVETPWTFSAFRLPTVWFSVVKFPTVSSRTLKLPTDPANVKVPTVKFVTLLFERFAFWIVAVSIQELSVVELSMSAVPSITEELAVSTRLVPVALMKFTLVICRLDTVPDCATKLDARALLTDELTIIEFVST